MVFGANLPRVARAFGLAEVSKDEGFRVRFWLQDTAVKTWVEWESSIGPGVSGGERG